MDEPPSPKVQLQLVISPVEASVKFTVNGAQPDVGVPEGTSVFEFIHEDDVEAVRANVSSRLTGEEIQANYEFRLRTKSGKVVYVDMRASIIQWHDGPAILAALYDVTDKRKAEQSRAFSDRVSASVFDLSPDMIVLLSLSGAGYEHGANDRRIGRQGMGRQRQQQGDGAQADQVPCPAPVCSQVAMSTPAPFSPPATSITRSRSSPLSSQPFTIWMRCSGVPGAPALPGSCTAQAAKRGAAPVGRAGRSPPMGTPAA